MLDSSQLGILREDGKNFNNMTILNIPTVKTIEDSYEMFQGKQKSISSSAN